MPHAVHRMLFCWLVCYLTILTWRIVPAQTLQAPPPQAAPESLPNWQKVPVPARSLLTEVLLAAIPEEYEDTRKWGGKKKVWDGLHMRLDGLELKTKRKWREAKHGTWKSYRITVVEPESNLLAEVSELREIGEGRVAFQLSLAAKIHALARLQEWRRDVRLLSTSVEADADVELDVDFEMATELDASRLPPALLLKPVATDAELRLKQFTLRRLGRADGPIVRELGNGLENILRKQLKSQRGKIVNKINKAMTKDPDKLKISIYDLWGASEEEPEGDS